MAKRIKQWNDIDWRAVGKIVRDHDGIAPNLQADLLIGIERLRVTSRNRRYYKRLTPEPRREPQENAK